MHAQRPASEAKHRTAKGAQRLKDLTVVAADMFLEQGFESVAIDDLIARVGGSRRNIYSHFGGKEGLFIEVVTQLCAELTQPLEQWHIKEQTIPEVLTSFGQQVLKAVLTPRALELHRLMVAQGKRFPALSQAVLHAGHFKAASILTQWIEAHQENFKNESKTSVPAHMFAQQFVSMLVMEAQLRALTGFDKRPFSAAQINSIVKNTVCTFLYGALAAKGM